VFLVLAAQYESLRLPLAIVLIVPLCLLFALIGVRIDGGDNNIFTQIGMIVLIGLACKNAILIVEFAKTKRREEKLTAENAALVATQLRFRPILMTSTAFIGRCLATGSIAWRRSRDATCNGYRGIFRNDWGHALRIIFNPYFLCDRDKTRSSLSKIVEGKKIYFLRLTRR
jgi:hypothetical protein